MGLTPQDRPITRTRGPMPPLICSFASHRSPPARLAKWIAHLESLREAYPEDGEFQETIAILLRRARQAASPAREEAAARAG